MKLLLIHTKEEKDVVGRLEPILAKLDIPYETFLLNSPQDIDITRFTTLFDIYASEEEADPVDIPTHILISSSLHSKWFDFLAGFAFGSRIRILIYGQEAIKGISKEFASFFTFIGKEASLQTYLEVENEFSKKQDAARNIITAQQNLLKMGVPVTVEALVQCVAENSIKEISHFIEAGFSINSRNSAGVPLLNIAARNDSRDVVGYLLKAGADVNIIADDRGTTALIDSVMAHNADIADDLLKAGTDLNVKDKNGQTALIVAAGASLEKIVELLLTAGADADVKDSLGTSARTYSLLFKNEKILGLFQTLAPVKEA